MNKNVCYVNNTPSDLTWLHQHLMEAYHTEYLPEELADLLTIRFVDGLNLDGSKRMIVEPA